MKKFLLALAMISVSLAGISQVVPNTPYHIKNGAHSSFLNVSGASVGNNIIHTGSATGSSVWEFINMGNGYFRIRNTSNGLYVANMGNRNVNAQLKQVSNPGDGALWSISGNTSTKFLLKNKMSGYFMSSGGNRSQNAPMVQAGESQYSYWDLNSLGSSGNSNVASSITEAFSSSTAAKSQQPESGWVETGLPTKYFGTWRLYSPGASKNDVTISSRNIMMGRMNTQIYRTYFKDGVYKVVTTLNNYYQVHFIKDRQGGIGDGGIYIIDIDKGYRSVDEANNTPLEGQKFDQGFR